MDPKAIARIAFPDYRGRKVSVKPQARPLDTTSFWDESLIRGAS